VRSSGVPFNGWDQIACIRYPEIISGKLIVR
jgi:hypothetical protein